MAKATGDLILRDRLELTLSSAGDQDTVYGRMDLSDYVNPVERKGLRIKEIRLQPRVLNNPDGTSTHGTGLQNTGVWVPCAMGNVPSAVAEGTADSNEWSAFKLIATTRAYESMVDCGIASPDLYHAEEWVSYDGVMVFLAPGATASSALAKNFCQHTIYGTPDLHPGGATIVSDLLIGAAADNWEWGLQDDTAIVQIDVLVIAEPVTITQAALNEIIVQQQDL